MAALRFLATFLVSMPLAYVAGWNYQTCACSDGPSTWTSKFSQCGGSEQSPIRLGRDTSESTFLGFFHDVGIKDIGPRTLTVTNTGHNVRIDGIDDNAYFIGAGLPGSDFKHWEWSAMEEADRYLVDHFIFHWGSENGRGSEHVLNGVRGDGEVQIVTYNYKYASLEEARANEDGVHIISYLIQVDRDAYQDVKFDEVVEALEHVRYKGQSHEFTVERLANLIPLGYINWYHRYRGSFTIPPCEETVIWSMVDEVLPISQAQMDAFRSLYANEEDAPNIHLGDNYREVQDLTRQARRVQYSDFVTNSPY